MVNRDETVSEDTQATATWLAEAFWMGLASVCGAVTITLDLRGEHPALGTVAVGLGLVLGWFTVLRGGRHSAAPGEVFLRCRLSVWWMVVIQAMILGLTIAFQVQ
jgi:hypothetical protein